MEQALLQKWDYLVEEMNSIDSFRSALSRLGENGWELIDVSRGSGTDPSGPAKTLRVRKGEAYCAIFKRPRY